MLLNLDIQFLLRSFCWCIFLSLSLFNVSSCWCCNEAWYYVIQLVDRLCNNFFKLKHLFLLSLHSVDNLVKKVDELGSEHHMRSHINEPPRFLFARQCRIFLINFFSNRLQFFTDSNFKFVLAESWK